MQICVLCVVIKTDDDGRSEERRDTENLGGRRWRRRVGPRVRIKEARDGVAARSRRVPLATHAKGRGAHVARESEGLVPADLCFDFCCQVVLTGISGWAQ